MLSATATSHLQELAQRYLAAGYPPYRTWTFDKGTHDILHNELRAHGFIEQIGTMGSAWRLTARGHDEILTLIG